MSSPSITDLQYLTTPPGALVNDAVAALINPSSNVTVNELVCQPVPGGQVVITPTTLSYADPSWPYYGHAIATYALLDLGNTFDGIDLNLTISQLPARSGNVATLLNSIFDVLLTPADVVDVPLPTILGGGTLFTLQASPSSLMWTGSVTVRLWPTSVETTNLEDLIINSVLPGLIPPAPPPMNALPAANDDWSSTTTQGVLRFRMGSFTINEGELVPTVGVLGAELAAQLPPGLVEGDTGTIEGGLPSNVDFSLLALSVGATQQVQSDIYVDSSPSFSYSDRWVQLIDSTGAVYYDGQLSAMTSAPFNQTLTPGEYALILQPRDPGYAALNYSDDWSVQAAVMFLASNQGGGSNTSGPGGSTVYQPNYMGFVTVGGYTFTNVTTTGNNSGMVLAGGPPSDTILDAIIYQTPNALAPPTPTVPTGLIINFVTPPDTSPFTLSDEYATRSARIIDSRGTVYWSGTLGNVGGTTALVPVGSDGGEVLPLVNYGIYALVVDAGASP